MSTKNVTLQFTSLIKLWDFRRAINAHVFEMNLHNSTITCECTEEQVQLALNQYGAKIYKGQKVQA